MKIPLFKNCCFRKTNIQKNFEKETANIEKETEKTIILDKEVMEKEKITEIPVPTPVEKRENRTVKTDVTVLIDCGHGKEVKGKRSLVLDDGRQLFEWEYAREIGHRLQDALTDLGIKSEFTNKTDNEIGLSKRAEIANEYCKKGKCILVSIHNNAAGNGKEWSTANGWEVWSTKGKTNSDKLANCFLEAFKETIPDRRLRGHKEENFTVLYKTNCPCVLTENFFMDNKEECEYLLSEKGKKEITNLHVNAILKYINL